MFLRRILPLLLAILIGYTLGYNDAYRGPDSLGWKMGELTDKLQPDNVRAARSRNAEAFRQKQREGVAIPEE
jgi:hypothetical protein